MNSWAIISICLADTVSLPTGAVPPPKRIAHRLSTVRNADRILVLTDEGIMEQGTHEQLVAAGVYAGLYSVQGSL